MKRLPFVLLSAAFALALVPATALAKGPSGALVDGPGLASPLRFGGFTEDQMALSGTWSEDGLAPGAPLMEFAEAAGFFPAVFPRVPDPMLDRRPKGDLGPRYVIRYRVPGPNNEEWQILQNLYPYAKPNPVTYMAPGQPIYRTETHGGWFVATSPAALLFQLTEAGLPRNPPTGGDASPLGWELVASLVAAAAALALGSLAIVVVRRRAVTAEMRSGVRL